MKRLYCFFLICLTVLCLPGCASMNPPISRQDFLLDTIVSVTLYDTHSQDILNGCMDVCRELDALFSPTKEGSDVYRINHAGGRPVAVDARTAELIRKSLEVSQLTSGAFDITIAPLVDLWDFKSQFPRVPSQHQIDEALSLVDYRAVQVEGNTVTLTNPKASIDLGGIAKGYIADRMRDYLLENGCQSAILDLGGNVYAMGKRTDGNNWTIGIRSPFDTQSQIGTLTVSDRSVVTSGPYERYFEVDGKRYHHILDPDTGYPVENGLASVTILSDQSTMGDALSTACFVLGPSEGEQLIQSLDQIDALFITDSRDIFSIGDLDFHKNS